MKTAGATLALLGCLAMAQAAQAAARDAAEPLVILTEQGSKDTEATAFFSSIRALAAEIGIVVSTEEVPTFEVVRDALLTGTRGERKPFLVAWIVRETKLRRIHLFDPWNNQLRTRTIEAGSSATANAEALALILRGELLAYLHEAPAPPPRAPASPPSPPPPPPDPRWAVSASYAAGTFLRDQGLQQGARLGIEHPWRSLRLGLAYGLFPSQDAAAQDVAITVRRHPIDLDLGYAWQEYHRLRWIAEAFVSGDWVTRHAAVAATSSQFSATPDTGRFLVSIGARGRQELRILPGLAIGLALGMEVLPKPLDFQIARASATDTVARVSSIRFSAELGIRVWGF